MQSDSDTDSSSDHHVSSKITSEEDITDSDAKEQTETIEDVQETPPVDDSTQRKSKRLPPVLSAVTYLCSTIGLGIFLTGYLVVGATVYQHIEGKAELKQRVYVKRMRQDHMKNLYNVTIDGEELTILVRDRLLTFQRDVYLTIKHRHWDGFEDADEPMVWSYAGALLFCMTIITTIGYGNITPVTDNGKTFTIIYGLVGIPLTLLFLANLGAILANVLRAFVWQFNVCTRSCKSGKKKQKTPSPAEPSRNNSNDLELGVSSRPADLPIPKQDLTSKDYNYQQIGCNLNHSSAVPAAFPTSDSSHSIKQSAICPRSRSQTTSNKNSNNLALEDVQVPPDVTILVILGYLYLGATLFVLWEPRWSFFESFYFCFITLTTIGFGDYVFGSGAFQSDTVKLLACAMYMVFGLALIAMSFELLQQNVKRLGQKIYHMVTGK